MTEEQNEQAREIKRLEEELAAWERKLAQAMAALANRQVEIEKLKAAMLSGGNGGTEALQADLTPVVGMENQWLAEYARSKGRELAEEMQRVRNRKLVRILERTVYRKQSQWDLLLPAFQQLKDDTVIYLDRLEGFALRPSVNLQAVPLLSYRVDLKRAGLKGIQLAFLYDFPPESGEVGIELVSSSQQILTQKNVEAATVDDRKPVQFDFTPLADSAEEIMVRVFARNVDLPVRVLELQYYPLFGLRHVVTQPFAGYLFE